MITKTEELQRAWHLYESEHKHIPSSAREAVAWAVNKGILALPEIDPLDVLAGNMARALREEYRTDDKGRHYRLNHAVRVTKGGVQYTFWAIMGYAPYEHMQQAFIQRREQIVGDCMQLKTDVDVFNDLNKDNLPIQLLLNFTEDVAEREQILILGLEKTA